MEGCGTIERGVEGMEEVLRCWDRLGEVVRWKEVGRGIERMGGVGRCGDRLAEVWRDGKRSGKDGRSKKG